MGFPGVQSSDALAISADGNVVAGTLAQTAAYRWVKNPADFNDDGFSNGDDYDLFASCFETGEPRADFNHDGFVNGDDYDGFAEAFEAGC